LQNDKTLDFYTLLLVKLHTGRTHQIRVHFKSIKHPLMGDELYGTKQTKLSGLSRQFLHARRIEVRLPDGTWIEGESEIPSDLKDVLRNLNSKKDI
jgi:23S rRNA pseudouridine1911/1915/1917 synthase